MRIHYIAHASFEPPGIIEQWAKERGFKLDGTPTYANKKAPASTSIDFLVVMGGPQSPLRMNEYPYLREEIKLISEVIDQNKPVIGFCLGSQLIADRGFALQGMRIS